MITKLRYLVFFFFCILFFSLNSCQKSGGDVLDRFSEEELIELLADVSMARAAVSGWPGALADSVKTDHYRIISQLHGIEENELYLILEVLSDHPDYFQKLLNAAADSLRNRNERIKLPD